MVAFFEAERAWSKVNDDMVLKFGPKLLPWSRITHYSTTRTLPVSPFRQHRFIESLQFMNGWAMT
jgi:hypothetical protein